MTTENAWFRTIVLPEPNPPTEAEVWFKKKCQEERIPFLPLYQDGPSTLSTVVEFRNGRSQKVFVRFPADAHFSLFRIEIFSVCWEGIEPPDIHKLLGVMSDIVEPAGGWRFLRKDTGYQILFFIEIAFHPQLLRFLL